MSAALSATKRPGSVAALAEPMSSPNPRKVKVVDGLTDNTGGTTRQECGAGASGEIDRDDVVERAAQWLATTPRHHIVGPIVPALLKRFALGPAGVCAAIREANLRKARAL